MRKILKNIVILQLLTVTLYKPVHKIKKCSLVKQWYNSVNCKYEANVPEGISFLWE